jgi:hypothetical protein
MAAATADVTVPLGKPKGDFRVYESSGGVFDHYRAMRSNQSLAFSRKMTAFWGTGFGTRAGGRMTVKQALQLCDTFVDRSDPDTLMPNSVHMLQAAEACRAAGKPDWFILCALLHDIGKLMYKWGSCENGQGGTAADPQWALGGVSGPQQARALSLSLSLSLLQQLMHSTLSSSSPTPACRTPGWWAAPSQPAQCTLT